MEVTQHVNETTVRCIMLSASEGLGKGMTVNALGHGLTAPVAKPPWAACLTPWAAPLTAKAPCRRRPYLAHPSQGPRI